MKNNSKSKSNKISLSQLVLLGLGSLIGSGWLFGAWEASSMAGPAAIISWVIGFLVIGTIAYNYIEIGTMFPQSGGMSNYAQYTHGSLLGFIAAWANWVSLVTIIPIEAVSAVQYMSSWPWDWAKPMGSLMKDGSISTYGLIAVYIIIAIFSLLNYWSVKLLTSFTSLISVFKLGVPILTIIMLLVSGFDTGNYGHSIGTFMPYGSAPIFAAPFADMAILLGLNWLAILLYMEAVVSPFGTGVSFVAVTGRVLRAMEENGHIPKFLGKINKKYNIPRVAIAFNAIISMVMVTLFRDWGTLAAVISTATLVAYLTGPTTVISLRKMAPKMTRPFKANILKFMAPLSFVLASLAIYWAMWPTTAEVILIIILGLPIYFFYEYKMNWKNTKKQIGGSLWIIIYIYFKRANKLNKKMGDKLRKTRKKARHKDWKERDRQEQNQ
ncbi:MAG: APC family permease [Staphylococcus epidermidis]|nr:APC family permease [Staphylococcus epidermidis]